MPQIGLLWAALAALSAGVEDDGGQDPAAAAIADEIPDASAELSDDIDRWVLHDLILQGAVVTPLPGVRSRPAPITPLVSGWRSRLARRQLLARMGGAPQQHHLVDAGRLGIDIPLAEHPLVDLYIDYFTGRGRLFFERWLQRASRVRGIMEKILTERGLPRDLVYLAMVESGFSAEAVSSARAVGFWQFIAPTAQVYGLRRTLWIDERRDFERATEAAADYLAELYRQTGDWHLAWASYNAGEGRVRRALDRTGARTFWDLIERRHTLAKETVHYVPKVIAAAIIAKDAGRYGFVVSPLAEPATWDEVVVERAIDLRKLAPVGSESLAQLRALNPALLHDITPPDTVTRLRVPPGEGVALAARIESLPAAQRLAYWQHRVRPGETLSHIARAYGADMRAIAEVNRMSQGALLRVGRLLVVPAVPDGRRVARPSGPRRLARPETVAVGGKSRASHTVAQGDTLWGIARRYGVTVAQLRATNRVRGARRLAVGDVIDIF